MWILSIFQMSFEVMFFQNDSKFDFAWDFVMAVKIFRIDRVATSDLVVCRLLGRLYLKISDF